MDKYKSLLWLIVPVFTIGPAILALLLFVLRRRIRDSRSKLPIQGLQRRPAGEALCVKLMELDDKFGEQLAALIIFPGLATCAAWFMRPQGLNFFIPVVGVSLIWTLIQGFRLNKTIRARWNYQLGYDGERFVGEELTRLIAVGFEVYHDVPFDGYNIDHVLVGPPGVYSVETKTRRKPKKDSKTKKHEVEFDGSSLHWPWGKNADDIDQAVNNGRTLSRWLTSAVGDAISVTPILTLPGWWVTRKQPGKTVRVLNPLEIFDFCDSKHQNLSESMIKRICHQLNEKCKLTFE